MDFFAIFLEVPDFERIKPDLIQFKQNMQKEAQVTVFDLEQSNYDFLYNSLIESANKERKKKGEK